MNSIKQGLNIPATKSGNMVLLIVSIGVEFRVLLTNEHDQALEPVRVIGVYLPPAVKHSLLGSLV